MTKIDEFRNKSTDELRGLLTGKLEALRKARFDITSGQLTNVREIRVLRKDIARLKTLLNEPQKQQSKPETTKA